MVELKRMKNQLSRLQPSFSKTFVIIIRIAFLLVSLLPDGINMKEEVFIISLSVDPFTDNHSLLVALAQLISTATAMPITVMA